MTLENIMLSERNQSQKITNCRTHLSEIPSTGSSTDIGTRFMVLGQKYSSKKNVRLYFYLKY